VHRSPGAPLPGGRAALPAFALVVVGGAGLVLALVWRLGLATWRAAQAAAVSARSDQRLREMLASGASAAEARAEKAQAAIYAHKNGLAE
jgi:hypothetical protein